MKIGLVGAPGSGKTTFGARLYASLLEAGVNSAGLVNEFAKQWLGKGLEIETLEDQQTITARQLFLEDEGVASNFSPLICDSVLWLGPVYAQYKLNNGLFTPEDTPTQQDIDMYRDFTLDVTQYDLTIFVPLFDTKTDRTDEFRIHTAKESMKIEELINEHLTNCFQGWRVDVPRSLERRKDMLETLVNDIARDYI